MSFEITAPSNSIQGVGNKSAAIMIVGDVPDAHAMKARKPFMGPALTVLEGCLHQAGLTKFEVYMTNLIKDDTKLAKYWDGQSGKEKIKTDISGHKQELWREIKAVQPKVIVTLDGLPAYVLTHKHKPTKIRGYPFKLADTDTIVIPSLHPGKMIWSNYLWRRYLSHDLIKARKLRDNPGLLWQPEIEYKPCESFEEAKAQLDYCVAFNKLSVDIEVTNYEVSCIGFATSPTHSISIPFDMRWTIEQELELWNKVANILGDERITKVGQNFIFDIYFLIYRMHIFTRGPIIDTMMGHSILYPDLLKGLGFLGSIYTMQPYWKDMVSFKDIKADS